MILVKYNNCHGQGYWNGGEWNDGSSIEGYVETEDEFYKWCDARNKARLEEGEIEEGYDEFDLIHLDKLTPKNAF